MANQTPREGVTIFVKNNGPDVQHTMELAYDAVGLRWSQQVREDSPPGGRNDSSCVYCDIWKSNAGKLTVHEKSGLPEAPLTICGPIG